MVVHISAQVEIKTNLKIYEREHEKGNIIRSNSSVDIQYQYQYV